MMPSGGFLTRRDVLSQCGMGMGALALAGLFRRTSQADDASPSFQTPLAPKQPHFPARAKRIVVSRGNGATNTTLRIGRVVA